MHDRIGHRLAGLGIGLALLLAGCGSDDGTGVRNVDGSQAASGAARLGQRHRLGQRAPPPGRRPPASRSATPASADATIAVELKEWSVLPARADVPAGTVTFEARNTGQDAHELVVGPRRRPGQPALAADGTVDEEKLPEGAFVGEIEPFPAGQSCTGTFELPAGRYALFCNILETEADGSRRTTTPTGCAPASRSAGSCPSAPRPRVATATCRPAGTGRLAVEHGDHPDGVAEQPGGQHAEGIRPLKLP
jgi:hypothetical protein